MPDIDSLHREEDASNGMAIANGALIAPDADVSSALTTQVDQQTFQRVVEENSRLFEQIERLQGQLLIVQAHSEAIDNMTRVIHDNARTIHQNAQAIQQNADFDPASIPGSIADRTSTTSTYLPGAGQATRPATVQQGHDSAQPVVQRMNVQQSPLLFNTSALSTNGERGFTPSIQLDQRGDSQSVDEVGGVARYNPRAPRDLPRPLHRAQGNRPIFRQVLGTIHDPRVGRVTEDNIGEAYFRLRNHADSLQSRVDVSDAENMRLRSTIESLERCLQEVSHPILTNEPANSSSLVDNGASSQTDRPEGAPNSPT